MKTPTSLLLGLLIAGPSFAQDTGLFINAGGGVASVKAADFTLKTAYNETLPTTDSRDSVSVATLGIGYRFSPEWSVEFSYSDYGTAEIHMGFPQYPGIFSVLPLPSFGRHVMKYESHRFAIVPSYIVPIGRGFRARGSAGISYIESKSHFEGTYHQWYSGRPDTDISFNGPQTKHTDWSFLVAAGLEYQIVNHLVVGASIGYSPYKVSIGSSSVGLGGTLGTTQPSKSTMKVDSFEGLFSLTWQF